ncbi:MAG TPA: HAMP domain-containing sensor histidine kinase [Xanthobacteraceae bacterium]|nr:HAMP domain-containing sensor histidine kinase [Xanthobacteraceae bacterium]
MVQFRSIFSRLIFSHAIAIVLTAIAMPATLYVLLESEVAQLHNSAMRLQAERIVRYLMQSSDPNLITRLPAELRAQYSSDYGRYAFAVIDRDHKTIASSTKSGGPVFEGDTLSSEAEPMSRTQDGAEISGVSVPFIIDGQQRWVQVAENISHRDVLTDDIVSDFVARVGWIVLPVLVLLLTIDVALFRRITRPLLKASQQALAIGPKDMAIRLPTERIPAEILPLVQSVNQALDRLEHGFRIQREFTADAAHELRTPLAVMRTHVESLEPSATTVRLTQDIAGMARVIGQMLDIAELDALAISETETADLQMASVEVVTSLAPLAIASGKSIAYVGSDEPLIVKGNYEMIYRAIRNLAENAINHTPPGSNVDVSLSADGCVAVSDEGPGLSENEREFLFQRFWRRDRRKIGNAGLGLSIVLRIAEIHNAEIAVQNRVPHGAEFSLRFQLKAKVGSPRGPAAASA